MSENENITTPSSQNKPSDKELNFRALEAKYQKQLEHERAARIEAERLVQESRMQSDDDDDGEPYVDKKKLEKKLGRFAEQTRAQTQTEIKKAVQEAVYEERKNMWLKSNNDFYDVLQHADKFAAHDPELAETILQMPVGFEREKLVYKSIKALGLHQERQKEPSIQEKIEANKRSPYYQPSGVGTSPYASAGNYSATGQKEAYAKMQELKSRLRLG
jgi:hypothetical protein